MSVVVQFGGCPSKAKAHIFAGLNGTAKAVPFPEPIFETSPSKVTGENGGLRAPSRDLRNGLCCIIGSALTTLALH